MSEELKLTTEEMVTKALYKSNTTAGALSEILGIVDKLRAERDALKEALVLVRGYVSHAANCDYVLSERRLPCDCQHGKIHAEIDKALKGNDA